MNFTLRSSYVNTLRAMINDLEDNKEIGDRLYGLAMDLKGDESILKRERMAAMRAWLDKVEKLTADIKQVSFESYWTNPELKDICTSVNNLDAIATKLDGQIKALDFIEEPKDLYVADLIHRVEGYRNKYHAEHPFRCTTPGTSLFCMTNGSCPDQEACGRRKPIKHVAACPTTSLDCAVCERADECAEAMFYPMPKLY